MIDFKKLQNGSDIRGIAMEGIPGEEVNLTGNEAAAIGAAFTYWLAKKAGKNVFGLNICIGSDSRLSADELKSGLARGICYFGSSVCDAGLASTPAMFMSTVMPYYEFDGAIMITASHLPYNRNGFKFFTAEGGLDKEDIAFILDMAKNMHIQPEYCELGTVNLMEMYAAQLRMLISSGVRGGLKGMKIVVDAGNGSGGFYAKEVLEPLGADVSASIFLEPDGNFPNHQPNPENKDAMKAICKQVVASGADLGIIFDTDVDRSAAVTASGTPIGRNEIVALAAALGAKNHPGGTVVTDSITSDELHEFLEGQLGLNHLRYKRGYRNVIGKAIEMASEGKDAFLAIETSGHAAFSENYYLDDGAYLAALIIIEATRLKSEGKAIEDLISGLGKPAEAKEFRMNILSEDFSAVGSAVLDGMPAWIERTAGLTLVEPNYEGVRANFEIDGKKGWFLLRKSLHDPVLPLNVESSDQGGIERVLPLIREYISEFKEVDSI